ncbi:RidA family protein [uncultured Gemmiger sp.]|uniref:RidA family protein n=1 Tax=uncultured Gemmiger sp. TaxID=1623490 RepID=UPI0025D7AD5B|nr:RidA family protein [uncultured Gemmiger sp.]
MKAISTQNAPAAIGPYSQALDLGSLVFVSGQIPVDPATGVTPQDVRDQARQSLANLKAILAEAGLTMADVVKTVVFLADLDDFAAVNEVYAQSFAEPFPARSCVQVAGIPKGAKVEIECIAVRN